MKDVNPSAWDATITRLPEPHVLQSAEWASIKAKYGWQPEFYLWSGSAGSYQLAENRLSSPIDAAAAALILIRSISIRGVTIPLRIMYVPKGPLLADWCDDALRQQVLGDLKHLARQARAIFIKIDPDLRMGVGVPGAGSYTDDNNGILVSRELQSQGWLFSDQQIQFRNTVLLDLLPTEEQILGSMKQKARYNIRLAARKGVIVRKGQLSDIDLLYRMYSETAARDGFVIRDSSYYQTVWSTFLNAGMAELLIADVDREPVGAIILFMFGKRAWYLYGMSRELHREKMPNYLLQWEAIRTAKLSGCHTYDLWGAPDNFTESDPLWGVYRFKEGLGGEVVRTIGAWDLPVQKNAYNLYVKILPHILAVMRGRGRQRIRQELAV